MLQVFDDVKNFPFDEKSVITLGSFDGIHFGHQLIIDSVVREAELLGGSSVLITFNPHPQEIIQKNGKVFHLLTTLSEKMEILRKTGLNKVLVLPFTREFSQMSAEEFIESVLLDKIGVKKVIIGHDHMFGHNRGGSFGILHEYGNRHHFEVEVVQAQQLDGIVVSSTKIRQAIENGEIAFANRLLGREYSLIGMVMRGDGIGHKLGFPTANIHFDHPKKLLPKDGVYLVRVSVSGDDRFGMCNLGFRPTFNGVDHRIEVNIFNFDRDIYGSSISISFIERLRDEMKFASVDDLKLQLSNDKISAEKLISNI